MKNLKNGGFPQVDLPVDYQAWPDITGKTLDAYGYCPCRMETGVLALCLQGTIRMAINLTEYVGMTPQEYRNSL